MFSLFNGIYDSYLAPSQLNLLVVGAPDAGKTTLLERLKVTEIPTRPRKGSNFSGGHNKTVSQRIVGVEEPVATLRDALIETGALEGRARRRASSSLTNNMSTSMSTSIMSMAGDSSNHTSTSTSTWTLPLTTTVAPPSMPMPMPMSMPMSMPMPTTTKTKTNNNVRTSTGNAVLLTEKKRRFSICPAPERYSASAQDQDEEFMDDDETEQLLLGGGGNKNNNKNNDNNNNNKTQGNIFRNDSFSSHHTSDPPQRVRCHSREFDVDTLDLICGDDDDDDDDDDDVEEILDPNPNPNGMHSIIVGAERKSSMQSIGLDDDDDHHDHQHHHHRRQPKPVSNKALQPPPPQQLPMASAAVLPQHQSQDPPLLQTTTEEYDLKAKAKMLPLRMIRPTIGTNLAKIDMYGAKCHIFDVGGRLQDLWERYYDDCDAVIFIWKLGEDPDKPPREPDSDDDDGDNDDDNQNPHDTIYKEQQEMLNRVRKSIPDDVPFLIIGHVFGNANTQIVDRMYTTDLLLPRYHNPMTGFCCSSAKTGAGIQSAMEWLIPLAKRQQKERIASKKEQELILEEQGKKL